MDGVGAAEHPGAGRRGPEATDPFSSEDLVEQGNTLPLIPLNIDPPEHVKYRRLLDPLFAPRRIDALETDIAARVNHFVDEFAERGSCDFTAEFAELFPSSVFLGMMGLPWDELGTLIELRDGLLRPGTREMQLDRALGDPARDRAAGLRVLRRHPRRARRRRRATTSSRCS